MKNNKGITLVSLMITIIVMMILVGITVKTGGNLRGKTKMSDYIEYMELVKLRADVVIEEAVFNGEISIAGKILDSSYIEETSVSIDPQKYGLDYTGTNLDKYYFIKWGKEDIAKQGIDKSILGSSDYFVIIFSKNNNKTVDVLYSKGCKDRNDAPHYLLEDMKVAIKE